MTGNIYPPSPKIDHFVMGCHHLAAGQAELQARLGIAIPDGGKHPVMSTHNALIQAGGDIYFELIAIDPEAPPPDRPRWFSLDDPKTHAHIDIKPRALCWVVGVHDLDAFAAQSPINLGRILSLARGNLRWRLTVPDDGHLPMGGLIPGFIEWPDGKNPSQDMPDNALRLNQITISSPEPHQMTELMTVLGIDGLANVVKGSAGLSFDVKTPKGRVILD
ncbi:MAG: VOC family protein [Alphaproteobacteria bacterium]|nr:VOC family protein [Alphaproteobacteria bacterium]